MESERSNYAEIISTISRLEREAVMVLVSMVLVPVSLIGKLLIVLPLSAEVCFFHPALNTSCPPANP